MSEEKKVRNWKRHLKRDWRLVIFDVETYKEVASYHLTMLNFYIIISSIVLVVALLLSALIYFTPVKKLIPGYGSRADINKVKMLSKRMEDMTKSLDAQQVYINSLRKMLTGNVEAEPPRDSSDFVKEENLTKVDRIEEDEILRKELELEMAREKSINRSASGEDKITSLEQMHFVAPLTGQISRSFEPEEKHYGIDILAPKNTPIKAVAAGTVIFSGWTLETGYTIQVLHAHNIITFYKHNATNLKDVGSHVQAGEVIAIIGNTGTYTDGLHQHFELWYKGTPVNPEEYIDFK